jgi:hypothetical protein
MLRPFLTLVAASLATSAVAQVPGGVGAVQGTDCQLRVSPAPSSWIITGYDPFAESLPEGTFGVTFVNEGGASAGSVPHSNSDSRHSDSQKARANRSDMRF